ncbi:MAG: T9SS type A sorting domain-containing protein [Flavobacteriales bacterium]|nr:T9SS type A sorting domain-containing protein [Flavobacteriales bacterium]
MASTINDTYDANCFCTGTSLCLPTQLTTTADPVISCGAVNLKLNGTSTIAATEVPGANKYQFRFTNTAGQPAYARTIAFPTRSFTLTPWYTKPLKAGRTYNVQVHASFDNGATWCDYGPSCTVKISWTPLAPFAEPRGFEAAYTEEPTELLLYPNPTNGDQVRIQLSGIDPELTNATLDITDLFGKRVMSTTLPLNDGALNTSLALPGALADGLYVVTIVTGEQLFTERLMIAR